MTSNNSHGLVIPSSAMTIGAHPDDAEFGAGGTLAKWAAAGSEVTMLIVTDGSKGTWDPRLDPAELADGRQAEQRRAADALGVTDVIHLDHVDGELELNMDLREELCRWIRTVRPQVLLTHDPWRRYMFHPDHRAAGMGTIEAVVAARDHLFFAHQGLEKHRPDALLLWRAEQPDHYEDISEAFDTKIEALLRHSSQTPTTMGDADRSEDARSAFVDRLRSRAGTEGELTGLEMAEAFKLMRP